MLVPNGISLPWQKLEDLLGQARQGEGGLMNDNEGELEWYLKSFIKVKMRPHCSH